MDPLLWGFNGVWALMVAPQAQNPSGTFHEATESYDHDSINPFVQLWPAISHFNKLINNKGGGGGEIRGGAGGAGTGVAGGGAKASSLTSSSGKRLSRMLEVMKKGRSTGSLSSTSRSDSERNAATTATTTTNTATNTTPSSSSSSSSANPSASEPNWRVRFTERLKFRVRGSADDVLGAAASSQQRSHSPDAPRRSSRRNRGLRRRHTLGGQRDFSQLQAMHDWSEQGGVAQGADELTAVDHLRPKCGSQQDFSIHRWIAHERDVRGGPEPQTTVALAADQKPGGDGGGAPPPPGGEQVNGGGPQAKNKAGLCVGGDAHPHKLSGAQVVRSRFYMGVL